MESYSTIGGGCTAEIEEKHSRFIAELMPVTTEAQAADFLASVRKKHRDARHHCFAYLLKDGAARCSDDGEPSGTAGVPILEILRHSGLSDVCLVVTRYFGGTLLGAGGLLRAYSGVAADAVGIAVRVTLTNCVLASVHMEYGDYSRFLKLCEGFSMTVDRGEFSDSVAAMVSVAESEFEAFAAAVIELTNGTAQIEKQGRQFKTLP